MTFARKYNTRFARPIPRNVLQLVRDNQVDALAEANEGNDGTISPFVEFNLARPKNAHFPAITVYRRATKKIENGNLLVGSSPEFAVEIADEADTPEAVQQLLEIRAEAVDSIVRTAAQDDGDLRAALLGGIPEDIAGLLNIEITEHVYGRWVPSGTKAIQAVALTLAVGMVEA